MTRVSLQRFYTSPGIIMGINWSVSGSTKYSVAFRIIYTTTRKRDRSNGREREIPYCYSTVNINGVC